MRPSVQDTETCCHTDSGLTAPCFPFILPIVVITGGIRLFRGHCADAARLVAMAVLKIVGYGIAKFWMSNN